jgi:concanavalin A-like lectin/glucanase superfamily protein/beta-propeller uncharacterized protein DUF5122
MKVRVLSAVAATALAAATVAGSALQASAATPTPDGNVSSTVAPSWQTNNTVWALAYANGVVYVGGQFTSVRPPGDPSGTGEVARTYLAAFSSTTGALESFDPSISGGSGTEITALAVSPDDSTLYVGGIFTTVNGAARDNLAAFSTSTGALTSWAPAAYGKVNTIAPSPSGSEIYIGGAFNKLAGQTDTYAGAVTTSGSPLPWLPNLNNAVTSIAVAPDDSRVIVGGYFTTFNGVTQNAIGSTNPTTGASEPFAATIVPNISGCSSSVKDVVISGTTAYIAAEGTGGGCFDGDFAANVSDGSLIWQNDCLGATQAIAVVNGFLFKGSHAHDCAYAPGGFPQVPNGSGWVGHYLLDQSLANGTLGHWNPNVSPTSGGLGPRAMATDGSQLFVGGDFVSVNGLPQQGFARFPAGPDPQYPTRPSVAPTVTSTSAGVDSVSFPAVSSRDIGTLTYAIYRDGGTTPIGTVTATSWPWALPVLRFRDTGLTPGSTHTYTYTASDGLHTTAQSPASAPVTVSATSPSLTYAQTVLADSPSFLWQLNETSGSTAADSSPNGFNGIYEPGTTQGVPGPIAGSSQTATAFDGQSGIVTSANEVTGPQTFSIEAWFQTTSDDGGKIIGFGNTQTGGSSANNNASPGSSSYDRHIYMMNDGQIVFGVWTGQTETIESPDVYNDGAWHYVVATLSPTAGMALYIDGQLVGTNSTTSAQAYSGYWRVGGDNLNGGWNLDPWGSNSQGTTEPASYWFQGSIGDVAVYPYALSAAQVAVHYAANALSH